MASNVSDDRSASFTSVISAPTKPDSFFILSVVMKFELRCYCQISFLYAHFMKADLTDC